MIEAKFSIPATSSEDGVLTVEKLMKAKEKIDRRDGRVSNHYPVSGQYPISNFRYSIPEVIHMVDPKGFYIMGNREKLIEEIKEKYSSRKLENICD